MNTTVTTVSGGVISDIKDRVTNIKDKYSSISIVVGGNDCDSNTAPDEIIDQYRGLIATAKSKATNVTVSSVCPRIRTDKLELNDKIDSVNAGLQVLCHDEAVNFVNNNSSFHLADGSVNDGYILADGVHLTRTATDKLAKNLGLIMKDGIRSVCKDNNQKESRQRRRNDTRERPLVPRPTQHKQSQQTHDDDDDEITHSFWSKARQKAARPTQRHVTSSRNDARPSAPHRQRSHAHEDNSSDSHTRCYNCYESNHVVRTCRFDRPVTCYQCNETGHKAKHHSDYHG